MASQCDCMILPFPDMTVLKDIRGDGSEQARDYLLLLLQEHAAFDSVSSLIVRCSPFDILLFSNEYL
jgi:hypothetical protein